MSAAVILGEPRQDIPIEAKLLQETAKREQAEIYSRFALTLLNEAVYEIHALTNEDVTAIRDRLMTTAENKAREKMLSQGQS